MRKEITEGKSLNIKKKASRGTVRYVIDFDHHQKVTCLHGRGFFYSPFHQSVDFDCWGISQVRVILGLRFT